MTSKKQQSISSFFTPKQTQSTASKSLPTQLKASSLSTNRPTEQNGIDGVLVTSDNDDSGPVISRRSSAKRSKAQSSDDEYELSDAEYSGSKRQKTSPESRTPQPTTSANGSLTPKTSKAKTAKITDRTSKYLFSTAAPEAGAGEEDEEIKKQKERLHHRFVKKLGRPDSIAEIRRRNHVIDENVPDGEEADEDDAEEDDEPKPASRNQRGAVSKKAGAKLTPMEQQVVDIKKKHADTVLIIEVGYKFRFFGEDARIAAKELSIVCIPGKYRFDQHPSEAHLDRFASASVPVHRLHVHVKRLVQAGHKVGVVRQLETAALKAAGDNRNAPFVRKLTNLYTKGTYIDDVEGLEGPIAGPSGGAPATGHLLCITETNGKGWGTDEKVHVGIVAVQPSTGDIIYDDFEDGFMRSEIETRLLHIAPCELLIVGELSKATEKLVQHLSGSKTNVFGDKARVERIEKPKTIVAQSYSHVSSFYADKLVRDESKSIGDVESQQHILDKVHKLSELVTVSLSAMIKHLADYGLEHVFDLTTNFQPFSARSHMLLNGNTLSSLEIYRNSTDFTERGSLFWVLDQTRTRFGQRLLRKWVGRPLLDKSRLVERIDAVEELRNGERTILVDEVKNLLLQVKNDLEKSLVRIYYKKCTRPELLNVLQTLQRAATAFAHVKGPLDVGFQSPLLNNAVAALPQILDNIVGYLDKINPEAAKKDDKYAFFREEHETDAMIRHKAGITAIEQDLDDFKKIAADKLRKKKVEYVTVAAIDFLIEVENSNLKNVPASWVKQSGTKKVSRFHSPEITKFTRERDQHKESLAAACDDAYKDLLSDISANYQTFRDCIQAIATLDCITSLAEVSNRPGYVKPIFTSDTSISVTSGRHPMVEQLLLDTYVPNNIDLSSNETRALLITGPNMGGKSSYVRQVALISIMGQIGSYVPAASAELGMLDAVFTRMGAFDNMMAGESTFMVELSETSDILKQATPRSLVILDELGRGTSTHDGVAIAHGVLDHIVRQMKCLLLFITHYQSLSSVASAYGDGELKNMHMSFTEGGGEDQDITFLYELSEGTAHRSYGLNVARLANVPEDVIKLASVKSKEMETDVQQAKLSSICKQFLSGEKVGESRPLENMISSIEEL